MTVQQSSAPAISQRPAIPLWRIGVLACVATAVATTVIAAAAKSAGVPVEVDGEPIPLLGFTQLTLLFSAVGVGPPQV